MPFLRGTDEKKKRPSSISVHLLRPPVCLNLCSPGSSSSGGLEQVGGNGTGGVSRPPVGSDTGAHCRQPGKVRKLEQLRFENVLSGAARLSGRPGQRHKTTAGHQHCNFLTYNKAISYFLPYK